MKYPTNEEIAAQMYPAPRAEMCDHLKHIYSNYKENRLSAVKWLEGGGRALAEQAYRDRKDLKIWPIKMTLLILLGIAGAIITIYWIAK